MKYSGPVSRLSWCPVVTVKVVGSRQQQQVGLNGRLGLGGQAVLAAQGRYQPLAGPPGV